MTPEQSNTERQSTCRADATDTEVDADCIRRRLQSQSARIEQREVKEALSKLEACGDLTDEQRRTVRLLGRILTWRLTIAPEMALKQSSPGDRATARTVARLFNISLENQSDSDCKQS
ncbi:glutamyl-tRNA reductase [Halorubrum sp. N11]|uniref:glutamyl-tRNA reductase n=1 Tax=Halorubrum sp. N11 TaxID=3402276 RepID=UPI003EB81E31